MEEREAYHREASLFRGLRGQALAWACTADEKTGLLGLPLGPAPLVWTGKSSLVTPEWEEREAGEAATSAGSWEAQGSSGSSDPQKWPVHVGLFSKYKSAVLGSAGSG